MKAILLIMIMGFLYLNTTAQQVYQSNVVTLTLPDGLVKTTVAEKLPLGKTVAPQNSAKSFNKRNYYKKDDITIGFWDLQVSPDSKRTLVQVKAELLEMGKNAKFTNQIATIKTYNNIQFLIYSYDLNNTGFYRFYSDYHDTKNIAGMAEFKIENKNKAEVLLTQLLNSVEFK